MAVFAPMPRASEVIAVSVNNGVRDRLRIMRRMGVTMCALQAEAGEAVRG